MHNQGHLKDKSSGLQSLYFRPGGILRFDDRDIRDR
jgi:hypothetical protein